MAIQVGIAPDSWGVWFPEHEKQPSWDRCMDEMKKAGYAGFARRAGYETGRS